MAFTNFTGGLSSTEGLVVNGVTVVDDTGSVVAPIVPGDVAFIQLSDVPNSYAGQAGQTLAVNGREDALEFVAGGGGGVTPTELYDALGTDGTTVTDSATTVLGAIGANNAANAFDSSAVLPVGTGSVLERLEDAKQNIAGLQSNMYGALGTDGTTVTDSALTVLGAIGANNANNAFDSSLVVANSVGSVLERSAQLSADIASVAFTVSPIVSNVGINTAAALGTDGTTVADSATTVLGAIGANNGNNAFDSSLVAANANGSVLERLDYLQGWVQNGAAPGTIFYVEKQFLSSAILTVGADVTAACTGDLEIIGITCQTDMVGLAGGMGFSITCDNDFGDQTLFGSTIMALGSRATKTFDTMSGPGAGPTVLYTGKKLRVDSGAMDCTGGGLINITIACRRIAQGADMSAA